MNLYKKYSRKHLNKICLMALLMSVPFFVRSQTVYTVKDLFEQLKNQPVTMADQIKIEQARTSQDIVKSHLYPNVDAYGRYDFSSTPTAMLPLPPNDLLTLVQGQIEPQPFSKNIFRIGAGFSMPVFKKSIYTLSAQVEAQVKSLQEQQKINLIKNEAIIISANANLQYMASLDSALQAKKKSLLTTKNILDIKVKNGRAPASAALSLDNAINEIELSLNDLEVQKQSAIANIKSLTGVGIANAVPMKQTGKLVGGDIKSLEPLREKISADELSLKAAKEEWYPSVQLQGNYSQNFASAYNNDQGINNDLFAIGLAIKQPIFHKSNNAVIQKNKLNIEASQNELNKLETQLSAQATQLENTLNILTNSISLYQKSIADKEELAEIARASYNKDRISIIDYLKYEDDVVFEKSKLAKAVAQKWQSLAKLCVIYGYNIQNIIQ